jgi:hypothetical protein
MPTATETSVRGDWTPSAPSPEVLLDRRENPEWHSLRLFGRSRHPDAFNAGGETRAER